MAKKSKTSIVRPTNQETTQPIIERETTLPSNMNSPKVSFSNVENNNASGLPFGKANYQILLLSIALLLIGFFIMTLDKEEFGFGFMGITLGPIIVFTGFLLPFYALFKKK